MIKKDFGLGPKSPAPKPSPNAASRLYAGSAAYPLGKRPSASSGTGIHSKPSRSAPKPHAKPWT